MSIASPVAIEPPAPRTSPWPVFWVASVAAFLVSLDSTMLYAAFGALRAGFPQATAADMSWVLNAYTVVYAAMLIPAGGLADTHGRKRVFLFGVTVFIAASAACGLAGSVGWLIAARVLQAVGAALLTPASLSIVLAAFPQEKRALTVSARWFCGKAARTIAREAGVSRAAPTACKARAAISQPTLPASPQAADAAMNSVTPNRNTRLRPCVSASPPAGISIAA